jgi:hypothetical protein
VIAAKAWYCRERGSNWAAFSSTVGRGIAASMCYNVFMTKLLKEMVERVET